LYCVWNGITVTLPPLRAAPNIITKPLNLDGNSSDPVGVRSCSSIQPLKLYKSFHISEFARRLIIKALKEENVVGVSVVLSLIIVPYIFVLLCWVSLRITAYEALIKVTIHQRLLARGAPYKRVIGFMHYVCARVAYVVRITCTLVCISPPFSETLVALLSSTSFCFACTKTPKKVPLTCLARFGAYTSV